MTASVESEEEIVKRLCTMDAPLNERLTTFSVFVREHHPEFAEAYDDLVSRLKAAKSGSTAPDTGELMPDFVLPDGRGSFHSLAEKLERGPLVISFNRGHWCPYCTVELHALKQALNEFSSTGAQVVSIMPDSQDFVAQVAADIGYSYPILSDEDNGYALSCNLVIWLGERIKALNGQFDILLEKCQGNDGYFVPIPATFVVRPDGRVAGRLIDPDFRRRMEIDDILGVLRGIGQ